MRFIVGIFLPKLWLGQTGITLGFELQIQNLLLRCLSSCADSKTLDSQTKDTSAYDSVLSTTAIPMMVQDIRKLRDGLRFVHVEVEDVTESNFEGVTGIGLHVPDEVEQF